MSAKKLIKSTSKAAKAKAPAGAELLLELSIEEIPSAYQQKLSQALADMIAEKITAHQIPLDEKQIACFSTPRRLIVAIQALPLKTPASTEEIKGPKQDAPAQAMEGFLRANNIELKDCKLQSTPTGKDPQAQSYFYHRKIPAQNLQTLLPAWINEAISLLPQKVPSKTMRFTAGDFYFIRPLRAIMAYFNGKPLKGKFEQQGLKLTYRDISQGNYLLNNDMFKASSLRDYQKLAKKSQIMIDADERENTIQQSAIRMQDEAFNFHHLLPEKLLKEVAGLCEYPHFLQGLFDKKFLELPVFLLESVLNYHQKHFLLKDKNGNALNQFLFIANGKRGGDGDQTVINGNENVLNARLEDAAFFIAQDLKQPIAERQELLQNLTFHHALGTMARRTEHIKTLALDLLDSFSFTSSKIYEIKTVQHAVDGLKSDLVSLTVKEFPELQGKMGGFYASQAREDIEVSTAIAEHYLPQHDGDDLPSNNLGLALSLLDKIDILCGFSTINELPTGSKDPFALRRTAIAIINILDTEKTEKIHLTALVQKSVDLWCTDLDMGTAYDEKGVETQRQIVSFIFERLIVKMKKNGMRHDCIDAMRDKDNRLIHKSLYSLKIYSNALQDFCATDDGDAMLTAFKRVNNMLRSEEKKQKKSFEAGMVPNEKLFQQDEEQALYDGTKSIKLGLVGDDFADGGVQSFKDCLSQIAQLRPTIDAFFDAVTIISDDAKITENRLKLLLYFRDKIQAIANFEMIQQ